MGKYPINKEYWPYSLMTPPVQNAKVAGFMGSLMRAPGWIWRDREVKVSKRLIESFDGREIELLMFDPCEGSGESAPCLVYYHGGGFFFGAAGYHYKLAKEYVLRVQCKVIMVQYRLAPKHPFPIPAEDCYAAYCWAVAHTDELGLDASRIAVGGDSAGGALAAAVAQMARERNMAKPLFQLLIYPVTDRKMESDSNRRFTDTPMWNSRLSEKMWAGYLPDATVPNIAYASPLEAECFADLPDAYVETAEFDCLHDEGIDYAKKLQEAGVAVELNDTRGTMHGFDVVAKAPTTRVAVSDRINYMRMRFEHSGQNSMFDF